MGDSVSFSPQQLSYNQKSSISSELVKKTELPETKPTKLH